MRPRFFLPISFVAAYSDTHRSVLVSAVSCRYKIWRLYHAIICSHRKRVATCFVCCHTVLACNKAEAYPEAQPLIGKKCT